MNLKKSSKIFNKQDPLDACQNLCRICLGEEEEGHNELMSPCKCDGTMKYIHILCLKEWLNSKKLVYNGERVKSYFWKALECELCK
jgi:E3 ubiquitin-protein ligase DOA10